MELEVEVEAHPKFQILYDPPPGTYIAICIGGRGGMKTYEVSKLAAVKATAERKRIVVLRDEHSLIKESILNEIWNRYETANTDDRILDRLFDKNETELKDRKTGKTLIYTKGFRATSNAKVANLKGPSDIDIAIMEEMEDLREESKFNTFIDGLRKEGCLIIVILNTPDVGHFLIKQYFNTIPVEGHDGYFRVEPKTMPRSLSHGLFINSLPLKAMLIFDGTGNQTVIIQRELAFLKRILTELLDGIMKTNPHR